jgi:predicted protein tyrosine phosphatase
MSIKHVIFTSQQSACCRPAWSNWAIISITDSGTTIAPLQDGWSAVLRVEFDDIAQPEAPYRIFTEGMAREIIEFVMRCSAEDLEGLLVHCSAGISRSAAVAKWIAEKYRLGFPEGYEKYNKHVYRLLKEEYQLVGFYRNT